MRQQKQTEKESKYVLSGKQVEKMMNLISSKIDQEKHFKYTVYTIYYETVSEELIERSCNKIVCKKRVRLRSYGIPSVEDLVYVELKESYEDWFIKERVEMTLQEAYSLLQEDQVCGIDDIDELIENDGLIPKFFVGYERVAYCSKLDPNIRITFSMNVRCRNTNFRLCDLVENKMLLSEDSTLMEVKGTLFPIWLKEALHECGCLSIPHHKVAQLFHDVESQLKHDECVH